MDAEHIKAISDQLALDKTSEPLSLLQIQRVVRASDLLRGDPMQRLANAAAAQQATEAALNSTKRDVATLMCELDATKAKIAPLQELNQATEQARQQLAAELAALKGA